MGPAGSLRLRARGNPQSLSSSRAPKPRKGVQPASAGAPKFCGAFGCSSQRAAVDEDGCLCCPLLIETGPESELLPLQEGGRALKPEYTGYAKVQLAIDSGAAASVMPEELVTKYTVLPGDA
eukprot:14612173-Alexandrium_andersonii.AAC.1